MAAHSVTVSPCHWERWMSTHYVVVLDAGWAKDETSKSPTVDCWQWSGDVYQNTLIKYRSETSIKSSYVKDSSNIWRTHKSGTWKLAALGILMCKSYKDEQHKEIFTLSLPIEDLVIARLSIYTKILWSLSYREREDSHVQNIYLTLGKHTQTKHVGSAYFSSVNSCLLAFAKRSPINKEIYILSILVSR